MQTLPLASFAIIIVLTILLQKQKNKKQFLFLFLFVCVVVDPLILTSSRRCDIGLFFTNEEQRKAVWLMA